MRFFLCAAGLLALSACSPAVPDSAAGVGFGDYDAYQAEQQAREARLAGAPLPSPMAVSSEPLDGGAPQTGDASDLVAETQAALREQALNSGQPVLHADPSNPPPQTVTTATGMSVETNFDAVSAERSIESDAALIAQNRARYTVVEPEALPARTGSEPNIVQYALSSTHPVGTRVYSRVGVNSQARFQRNCAGYTSPDKAQIDFMSKGGPQRDRMGLDPDGDGYACGWDPSPFRKALGG
ncbi:carbamoyl-phosphate synthase small subunit [Roseobacter sp. AzwK-3b]|uniref:hypothetical protein n=1 Tax=Roseobacter sp. AzwK-3b TaxID=351016 RepID=UPI000156997F|nr:hypothetical protein [Roseobacter sp. AzwK-3b]EDM72201.1 carbamoyl-phosphate synthase small subunit [Roseobacter sp. AzwK-3b]